MPVKKRVRRIDLIAQRIIALYQQLLREPRRILSPLQRQKQPERIKRKPDLRRIAIDFVNRSQKRGQRARPSLFILLVKKVFKGSHISLRLPRNPWICGKVGTTNPPGGLGK